MATYKHLRSSTANKRPTTSIADGQLAINSNAASAGLFFKDSTGATIIKVGPVHVGTTAPNATPGAGGSSGNSTGEVWLDTSLTPVGVKIWNGSAWVNGTPIGSTTVQGLLELATDVETQAGSDAARAVTPSSLQSKVSDSTSTTSSTTIASSTAVKSAFDLANAALPKSGGTVTGNLEIGTTGSLTFEGSVADGFETTIAVTNPTADRTITLPDQTGNMLVSGNASIVNADVNASAAIAGTKISPDFGSQTITTTGIVSAALGAAATPSITFTGNTNTGIYSPGADQLAISTNGTGRLFVASNGQVGVGAAAGTNVNFDVSSAGTTVVRSYGSAGNQAYFSAAGNAGTVGVSSFDIIQDATSIAYLYQRANQPLIIGTNNQERLRITPAGLVGVGTSSPATLLHLNSAAATNTTLAYSENGALKWYNRYNASDGSFQIVDVVNTATRLHISNTGNVGVGSTAPQANFVVSNGGAAGLEINPVGYDSGPIIQAFNRSTSAYVPINTYSSYIAFNTGTSAVERVRVTPAGNVGIGVSAPGASLDLNGDELRVYNRAVSGTARVRVRGYDNNSASYLSFDAGGVIRSEIIKPSSSGNLQFRTYSTGSASGGYEFYVSNGSAEFEAMRLDTAGRLAIGATTAGAKLDIKMSGATRADGVIIRRSTNDNHQLGLWTTGGEMYFDAVTDFAANPGQIVFRRSDNTGSSFSESARLDQQGRLLVGTSSALTGSTAQYSKNVNLGNSANSAGNAVLAIGRGQAVAGISSGNAVGSIFFTDNAAAEFASIECFADAAPAAGDYPGRLVFSTTADGASSPTERMRISQSGMCSINTTLAENTSYFDGKLRVVNGGTGSSFSTTGSAAQLVQTQWHQATTGDNGFTVFGTEASFTLRGSISYNRAGGVVAYNTTSDYRAKTILGDIEDPGSTIDALRIYRGVMNGATVERPMLIAHEAQEVAPYCVTGEKDAVDGDGNPIYQQMDHQVLVPLLIAEIQQLRARVAALETA